MHGDSEAGQWLPSRVTGRQQVLFVAVAICVLFALLWFTQTKAGYSFGNWNDASRLATVDSLLHRSTWRIDDSPYTKWTGDKILLNGHWISTKPPLLEALGAVAYGAVHALLRLPLDPGSHSPGEPIDYRCLTFLTVGLPSAALLAFVFLGGVSFGSSIGRALLGALLLAFATMVLPYSLVLNNHLPAATALVAGFLLLIFAAQSSRYAGPALFAAGLATSLAVSFDLSTSLIAVAWLAMAAVRHRWKAWVFVLGALPPIIVTVLLDFQITGGPLPPYFSIQGYQHPGSNWDATVAALRSPQNVPLYAFRSLVGDRGLLSHSPILLWPMAGLMVALCRPRFPFRVETLLLTLGVLAQTVHILLATDNFGGRAYGARWFLVWVPLLFFYLPLSLPSFATLRSYFIGMLFGLAVAISILSAAQGVNSTWVASRAPVYLAMSSTPPYLRIRSSLGLNDVLALNWMIKCPRWDLDPGQILRDTPRAEHVLWANFDNALMVLGYDLPTRRLKAGESFSLTVYWKALNPAGRSLLQFNALLDAGLEKRGGVDRRPAGSDTACWKTGEIIRDTYLIPVYAQAQDGVYTLQIGLFSGREEQAKYLSLVQDGQNTNVANITIGPLKVGGPPPGATVSQFAPQHRLDIELGKAIRLVGYDLSALSSEIRLTLYWQSATLTDFDYTVFVHLVDTDGHLLAQLDRPPRDGTYPTSLWDPGETIRDDLVLHVPPQAASSECFLRVGLYEPTTGTRLPIPGSINNAISLGPLAIAR